ncbi:DUF2264 domain-containing protein [Rugosimonospora africana]|uniref:DUF2264 domain-containing protein n=1 Tax=Rugosimonospora africana TaxID=556532 RepID=A0A8J3R0Z2_9ACTN|nr:DUF2264 domain-containing protein [Rugosimonospora africana]GIH19370.1 hypothetical protein Raf01_75420 [Rugosimonospora africana]
MSTVAQPPHSPLRTGQRAALIAYADRLLRGAAAFASPTFARITPPGPEGGYGTAIDGLEGFARTFLLAGFRIVGARGEDVDELIADYTRGIVAGVDPASSERWVRPDEHRQAKVEAASIALILDMTRPWIWDRLDVTTQQRVIDYLSPVVGDDTSPRNNWVWFRIVVETFLRSVGGPWSASDIAVDLARHDSFARDGGWFSDGPERSYDHYVGWALHLYPVLWSRMQGADEIAPERFAGDRAALDEYLQDAVHLVGADGSPLIQGRSLIYRFAAAAPFWVGVLADVPSVPHGRLRDVAMGIVAHFDEHGIPDADERLTLGWHDEWRRLAQGYSGPGSPYWASKGLLGVALPADHPVWRIPAEPLPAADADDLRIVPPAGWVVSGTASDGIVRVVNHGTDHAAPDDVVGDSPLYARLGYSTAASPLLNGDAWTEPLEQSAALIDARGRATHRAAMSLLGIRRDGDVAVAASTTRAHWLDPFATQDRYGPGIVGDVTSAGRLTTCSVVRGAWEVRITTIDDLEEGATAVELRVGGWAVAADAVESTTSPTFASATADVVSTIVSLGGGDAGVERRVGASPLGFVAAVPVVRFAARAGERHVVAVHLGATVPAAPYPDAVVEDDAITVTWPDGARTTHALAFTAG